MSSTTSNAIAPIGSPAPPLSAFDSRLMEIDIVLPTQTFTFNQEYAIQASGIKFGNANQNTCECRIFNLPHQLRNTILSLASPLISPPLNNPASSNQGADRKPVIVNLRVGRSTSGLFLLYTGNVISCEVTQPPDIGLTLRSLTNNFNTGALLGIQQPANAMLSQIASNIAVANGLFLDFEATDKQINNYNSTTSAAYNIKKLNQMGGIQAGVDNSTLWVINAGASRKNTGFLINAANGMVGIPQVTDQGVTVRVMMTSAIQIGGQVTVSSETNPTAKGTFKVCKMDYEVASRDQPFWFNLLCSNLGLFNGALG